MVVMGYHSCCYGYGTFTDEWQGSSLPAAKERQNLPGAQRDQTHLAKDRDRGTSHFSLSLIVWRGKESGRGEIEREKEERQGERERG